MELKKNPRADVHQFRGMLFSLSLAITLGMVVTVFEWKSEGDGHAVNFAQYDNFNDELLNIPITEQVPPPPPKAIVPKITEVPDEEEIKADLEIKIDAEINEPTEAIRLAPVEEIAKEETDEIFVIVEDKPQFPGGNAEFLKFLRENMHYPRQARSMAIEGKVFVQAIVGKDGALNDIVVLKGIGGGCDEEAVRVVAKSPKWKPGRQRGNAVKTKIVIPIVFKLG
ncbi:MAG TPA: TonB family protein [Cyclobacteriaceae bacterium]|nr:TonB family protein [Cyclobacteriaceae bacterium]MCB9239099.1 TonB family protein [Flammeovirgaceae bacterium]MCB0499807.1 TonB family protein [Cyclobacteriaceae bacterium]MCO5271305.1 TonB family protein [Cyclobacteriaceae bacterium]MCW5902880.1 TonB family protein [Cyclobacteriaceae bacterium]